MILSTNLLQGSRPGNKGDAEGTHGSSIRCSVVLLNHFCLRILCNVYSCVENNAMFIHDVGFERSFAKDAINFNECTFSSFIFYLVTIRPI